MKIKSASPIVLGSFLLAAVALCLIVFFWFFYLSTDCKQVDYQSEVNSCTGRIVDGDIPYLDQPGNVGDLVVEEQSRFNIIRATSNTMYSVENGKARHHYSRRSVWNLDEKYLIIAGNLVNSADLSILKQRPGGMGTEQIWSAVTPEVIFGIAYSHETPKGMNQFGSYNVNTEVFSSIRKFSDHQRCRIGNGKGVLSYDDQFVVIDCEIIGNKNEKILYSLDVKSGQILGTLTVQSQYRWGGVTPSGQYILAQFTNVEEDTTALYRYSADFQNKYLLSENIEHGDVGVDLNGDDIYAMIGWEHLMILRVSDGHKSVVTPFGPHDLVRFADDGFLLGYGHLSCRNVLRPGWCYFSSSNTKILGAFAIARESGNKAKVNLFGEVYNHGIRAFEYWGKHNSSETTYDAQTKISVSPSGNKIIVTSDWNNQHEINDYLIEIRK